jgi:hypothetical protein
MGPQPQPALLPAYTRAGPSAEPTPFGTPDPCGSPTSTVRRSGPMPACLPACLPLACQLHPWYAIGHSTLPLLLCCVDTGSTAGWPLLPSASPRPPTVPPTALRLPAPQAVPQASLIVTQEEQRLSAARAAACPAAPGPARHTCRRCGQLRLQQPLPGCWRQGKAHLRGWLLPSRPPPHLRQHR